MMLKFLGNDFTQDRWKTAALKNAYALLSKNRYGQCEMLPLRFSRSMLMGNRIRGIILHVGGSTEGCDQRLSKTARGLATRSSPSQGCRT